ncbi:leucine-rich repeat protein [Faecalibacterium hominis (ex Afrizal et al. 2022)]|nr:leucine-rich repeat protein [Faecalibacterium hominis (ex Afrizal et al. 2022)]
MATSCTFPSRVSERCTSRMVGAALFCFAVAWEFCKGGCFMKKRLVSLLLAFSMMLTFLPVGAVTAFAEDPEWSCGANASNIVTAHFNSASGTLTFSGEGAMENYQTMHFVAPWKEISNQIKKIVIENGVTSIGSNAFYQCSDMQATLDLSDAKALTSIGNNAFYGCKKLTGSLEIPDSVTEIGAEAFLDCNNLSGNFELPEGLQSVGNDAFYNCYNLTGGLKLPDTVTSIGTGAFYNCANLDGYLVLSSSLTKIPKIAFNNCVNLKVEDKLVIPSSVTVIEDAAFARCSSLTGDLEIPDTVTSIGNNAFYGCSSLNGYLTLPSQLTVIPSCAFWNCSQLKVQGGLKIPENVKSIGWGAFRGCAQLKGSLTLPKDIESIGRQAFYDCTGLTGTFKIPDTVTEIEQETFYHCGLDFIFPSNVTSIGLRAFDACVNFKGDEEGNFMIRETVQTVREDAFKRAGIKRLFLPQNLQNIRQIDEQNRAIYYNGTRAELEEAIGTNNFTNLDRANLKIGSQDIRYLCDVTFNPNGGTFEDGTSAPVTIKEIWRTEKVATKGDVPATPTRKGYVFDGWYYTDNVARAMTAFDPATEGVPDTITLYAAWRQTDTLATVAISGLSDGDTLVKGKEYPFTVKITPDGDAGNGKLTLTLANGGTLYQQKDDGTWEEMTSSELDIALVSKSYQFKLVPDQTGPNTLTAGVQKDGLTGAPNTDEVNFTVRDYEDGTVTIEGLENAVIKEGESKDFTVRVDPKDDTGKGKIDFGGKNGEVQYKDGDDWKDMPADGLEIDLDDGAKDYEFRITPKMSGEQTLTVTVTKENGDELGKAEAKYTVNKKDVFHTLTVIGGTVKVDGTAVAPDADNSYPVKEDAVVEVSFDRSILSDAQTFDQWTISDKSLLGDPDVAYDEETFTFTMPHADVKIESMTRDASIDEGPNLLEKGAAAGTVIVGGVVLLYQGHMLGTELYLRYLLPHGAIVPQNRAELAVLLWQDAGNPEPVSTALYSDISNEDSAIQQAARWAVENDLMELLDADEHPDHFDPFAPVTFTDSIHAWKKAQERKQTPTT